jgi:hypothetical protein
MIWLRTAKALKVTVALATVLAWMVGTNHAYCPWRNVATLLRPPIALHTPTDRVPVLSGRPECFPVVRGC